MTLETVIADLKVPDNKPIAICVILAVIGLILPLPYGFYILLRLVFFGVLIWVCLRSEVFTQSFLTSLPGLFVILAFVLYNPLFLVHLGSKFAWIFLNGATVWLMLWLMKNQNRSASN